MTTPINISNRREMFLDDFLVDRLEGDARRVFHQPVPREIVLTFDQPWEGCGSAAQEIMQDGDLYRMVYRAANYTMADGKLEEARPGRTAYAESNDGIHWTRPELGQTEFEGDTRNNLLRNNLALVFKDAKPGVAAAAQYKAISVGADHGDQAVGGGKAVFGWQSPDAIHWERIQDTPIYDKRNRGLGDVPDDEVLTWLDSVNVVYWCAEEQQYVLYYRVYTCHGELQSPGWTRPDDYFQARVRHVEKAVSDDFVNWQRIGLIDCGEGFPSVKEQIYLNGIAPYRRAPHIRIAMPGRYSDPGWTASHDHLPNLDRRRYVANVIPRGGSALTDTLLMWSRDGQAFTRCPETFLKPGPQRPGSWVYADHWAVWHLVETASDLAGAAPELSVYAQESYDLADDLYPAPTRLRRYALRLDGFASIHADMAGGELVTPALTFEGKQLTVNFVTSAAGTVRIEIQDEAGKPIPGFALEDSDPLIGDDPARVVTWGGKAEVADLSGRPVRLRFALKDADLYALKFTR